MAAIGTGKLLADLPELKPVEKFAAARLTGVSYCSKAFMQVIGSPEKQMEGMVDTVRQTISQISEIPPQLNERIVKDAESLAADLKGLLPVPGANVSISMLVDRGVESYRYDWSQNVEFDGSKPLGLLNHVVRQSAAGLCIAFEILARAVRSVPQMGEKRFRLFRRFRRAAIFRRRASEI